MEKYDFVAVDFETANRSFDSACAVGIAAVRNLEIADTFYSLIHPPGKFLSANTEVHGITEADVKDAPDFYELWPRIAHYFGRYPVVAHNAVFDMSVLKRSCPYEAENFKYVDTISLCRDFVPGKKNLPACASAFGIELRNHHNALDDAVTCAGIAAECVRRSGASDFRELCFSSPNVKINNFSDLLPGEEMFIRKKSPSRYPKPEVKISDIVPTVDRFDKDNPFYGKAVVFTGDLSISRAEAMQLTVNCGAAVRAKVSQYTDYLVVGTRNPRFVGPSGVSRKERDAEEINRSGAGHIELIDERLFNEIVKGV